MTPSTRSRMGVLVVAGGPLLSLAHHAIVAPTVVDSPAGVAASFLPPVLAATAALLLLRFVREYDAGAAVLGRAAVWYLGAAGLFGAALYVTYRSNLPGSTLAAAQWFSITNWAISGSFIGLLLANYDLRRTRALHRARRSERTADRLSERLAVLNRVLRHDVRNRANVIQGYAQLLAEQATDGDAVAEIDDAAGSLVTVADRMRRAQRILEEDTPEPVSLSAVLEDLLADLAAEHPDVSITASVPGDVTAETFPAIRTVLAELLENTVEHNPAPAAECCVSVTLRRRERESGNVVEVVVADNGPGIPDRERAAIASGDETQLTHSRGTSLWLTRWVATESGGTFAIDDADDGTRIRLELPSAE